MMDWSFRNGSDVTIKVAENFLKDWTNKSENLPYMSEYNTNLAKRSYNTDYYDSTIDPRLLNLSRHMAGYADPLIKGMFDEAGLLTTGKQKTVEYMEGYDIYIKQLFRGTQEGAWCR